MAVKINIDGDKIQVKMDKAWKTGLEMLSSEILKDCNLYCKQDQGFLIMSSYIHSQLDKGLLVWQTPYAARQYYEIKTAHTDKNPNATWRWCETAKTNHLDEWNMKAKAILRYYK